jgi:hypothetical protein
MVSRNSVWSLALKNHPTELPIDPTARPTGHLQVKSIQMFRRPARRAAQGDRAAMLVTQLDPKLMERGLAAAPGSVPTFSGAVAAVEKVRFYDGAAVLRAAAGGWRLAVECVGLARLRQTAEAPILIACFGQDANRPNQPNQPTETDLS